MSDLTKEEQANVRLALRYLRHRCGNWARLAQVLKVQHSTLAHVAVGQAVSASLTIRVARLAGVPIDDVITGRYPLPGTCPHCGHRPPDGPTTEAAR